MITPGNRADKIGKLAARPSHANYFDARYPASLSRQQAAD